MENTTQKIDEKKDKINYSSASIILVALCVILSLGLMFTINFVEKQRDEPVLESWNDNPIRSSIIYFMDSINNKNGTDYVEVEDRIAVFDNDGTLIVEKPMSIELSYRKDNIPQSLKEKHPYTALLSGDLKTLFKGNNYHKILNIDADLDPDAYSEKIKKWLRAYKHPRYNKSYLALSYKPMVELIEYLKDNDFTVYIVTGSDTDFTRVYADSIYKIPENHIIGSITDYDYNDGVLKRSKSEQIVNLGKNKPILIERVIGKKPIVAFGNTDNDYEMLEYVGNTDKMKLVGIITHTDKSREYEYKENEKILKTAEEKGWLIVDMRLDFKEMFSH